MRESQKRFLGILFRRLGHSFSAAVDLSHSSETLEDAGGTDCARVVASCRSANQNAGQNFSKLCLQHTQWSRNTVSAKSWGLRSPQSS